LPDERQAKKVKLNGTMPSGQPPSGQYSDLVIPGSLISMVPPGIRAGLFNACAEVFKSAATQCQSYDFNTQ